MPLGINGFRDLSWNRSRHTSKGRFKNSRCAERTVSTTDPSAGSKMVNDAPTRARKDNTHSIAANSLNL